MEITYNGIANTYIQRGPSGQLYTFQRGIALSVDAGDAAWFLGAPTETFVDAADIVQEPDRPEEGAFNVNEPTVELPTVEA